MANKSTLSLTEEGVIEGRFSCRPIFNRRWGANRRGCSCRPVFNKRMVLIEGVCMSATLQ